MMTNSTCGKPKAPIINNKSLPHELSTDIDNYPSGLLINLNKPFEWTSADAVRKLKFSLQRKFGKKNIKVGHAGTLDPLATGVLIICVGNATKIASELQDQTKEYIAQITFGATTPSFDLEKEIDATFPYEHITLEKIEEALKEFIGEQEQIPPLFSAKLIDGRRAYEIAREGKEATLKSSKITIYQLEIIEWESPTLLLRINCSKGTYIRSLARDLGLSLESGAHLSGLTRTKSGDFTLSDAISMEKMKLFLE